MVIIMLWWFTHFSYLVLQSWWPDGNYHVVVVHTFLLLSSTVLVV